MRNHANVISSPRNRRSFLKTGLAAAGAVGTGLLARGTTASAQLQGLTAGDTAILLPGSVRYGSRSTAAAPFETRYAFIKF
jgi:hypothetical protein